MTPWLLSPWNFPGENTEVGCHFLLQGISQPRDRTHNSWVSCIGRWVLLTAELPGKPTHIHILVSISPWICRKVFLYLHLLQKLEKGLAIHSSILTWRIPWTEEPGGPQSMGSQRVWRATVHGVTESRTRLTLFYKNNFKKFILTNFMHFFLEDWNRVFPTPFLSPWKMLLNSLRALSTVPGHSRQACSAEQGMNSHNCIYPNM